MHELNDIVQGARYVVMTSPDITPTNEPSSESLSTLTSLLQRAREVLLGSKSEDDFSVAEQIYSAALQVTPNTVQTRDRYPPKDVHYENVWASDPKIAIASL